MNAFLTALGTKLAERWLTALAAPGLLWIAVLTLASRLGHGAPFEVTSLVAWLNEIQGKPAAKSPATVLLVVVGLLLASIAAGLLAGAAGSLAERCLSLPGLSPPASWLLGLRRRRWDRVARRLADAIVRDDRAAVARYQTRRLRLGPDRPLRPGRAGDRFARTVERVRDVNGLDDLPLVWPRLWATLPDTLRTEVATARKEYGDAARLYGWGLLYLTISVLWWPAAVITVAIFVTAAIRVRTASGVLADLIETSLDLHLPDLAERLRLPDTATGAAITTAISGAPTRPGEPDPV